VTGKGASDLETEAGLWKVFMVKSNALEVQRLVAPWLIAMYGLGHLSLSNST
jgi:hypothetical protein